MGRSFCPQAAIHCSTLNGNLFLISKYEQTNLDYRMYQFLIHNDVPNPRHIGINTNLLTILSNSMESTFQSYSVADSYQLLRPHDY